MALPVVWTAIRHGAGVGPAAIPTDPGQGSPEYRSVRRPSDPHPTPCTPREAVMVASEAPPCALRSDPERPDPQLRCHQPDQAPGKRFLERLAVKGLLFRRMQRHHPARMVDVPRARAAARGDRAAQRVLEGTAVQRGIDARLGDGTGGTRRVIRVQHRTITRAHQHCSIAQRATHASQTSAMTAGPMKRTFATRPPADLGRPTTAARGSTPMTRANNRSGVLGSWRAERIRPTSCIDAKGGARIATARRRPEWTNPSTPATARESTVRHG
jgi:hypothetical protein